METETFEHQLSVIEIRDGHRIERNDAVAIEEPMEIRVVFGPLESRTVRSVSVTMRTPGDDEELALGFLFAEGIIRSQNQIISVERKGIADSGKPTGNTIRIDLLPDHPFDFSSLQRSFFTHSSCGVCGKSSIETLAVKGIEPIPNTEFKLDSHLVGLLPNRLKSSQPTFAATGGIHAAGFADEFGDIVVVREDVGRHNAVDKLLGYSFLNPDLDLSKHALVVSGRASFELVQKAIVARIPAMIAVGAPSSLAVEMAHRYRLTLVGFASEKRFNIYTDENGVLQLPPQNPSANK